MQAEEEHKAGGNSKSSDNTLLGCSSPERLTASPALPMADHVQQVNSPLQADDLEAAAEAADDVQAQDIQHGVQPQTTRLKDRVLFCPSCKKRFTNNKMSRLLGHVTKVHFKEPPKLKGLIRGLYPEWQAKSKWGFSCPVCHKFIRQSVSHLQIHHKRLHPDIPFKVPEKSQN